MGNGKDYIAVASARTALSGKYTIQLLDIPELKILWSKDMPLYRPGGEVIGTRRRYNDIEVFDMDKDGKEEIVFGHSCGGAGELTVYNHKGQIKLLEAERQIPLLPYTMSFITHVKSSSLKDEYILRASNKTGL